VIKFLASLDSSYESVISQMLLLTDLPSLDEVMNRVEGEEIRQVVMGPQSSEDPEAKAMMTSRPNPRSASQGD
jgi:hypothetical protein